MRIRPTNNPTTFKVSNFSLPVGTDLFCAKSGSITGLLGL